MSQRAEAPATWHIGPPCVLRVNVSRRRANSRLCSCASTRETTLFPVQRIDKEGRDAPDFSSGELRNTTRRLHLPSPIRITRWLLGMVVGPRTRLRRSFAPRVRAPYFCLISTVPTAVGGANGRMTVLQFRTKCC